MLTYQIHTQLTLANAQVLVIGLYEDNQEILQTIEDKLSVKLNVPLIEAGFKATSGNVLPIMVAGSAPQWVIIAGLGKTQELTLTRLKTALGGAIKWLQDKNFASASICISHHLEVKHAVASMVEGIESACYRYTEFKSSHNVTNVLQQIAFVVDEKNQPLAQSGLTYGQALASGMNFCKTLGNKPGNVLTPNALANEAKQLAEKHTDLLSYRSFDEKAMQEMGMNTLLAVAKGSVEAPKLIEVTYRHPKAKNSQPIVLVGKGVTFDSGGISLKPGEAMDEMKYDMCGAASVLGTLEALAHLNAELYVIGMIPAVENMPSGQATKPGDVVTSMSGQTVEILNTDAEGRLILCDVLTYVERFNPKAVIDIATLTGAIIVALGRHAHGLFANQQALADELLAAGNRIEDRAWQLPIWDDYAPQLDSNFADMSNLGGREAGSITAAIFLSKFAKKYPWVHLDIAGTAWKSGKEKGATGKPVPLLVEYLLQQ